MSSSKRFARTVTIAASAVGTAAIVAAAVIGLTGWPPTIAVASPVSAPVSDSRMLGVDASTAVALGPEVPVDGKFGATTSVAAAAQAHMLAPAAKRSAKAVVKKAAPRKHVARAASRGSRAAAAPRGWSSARVSWYGPGFYGHTMAGGGKLTPSSMVVAHRSLPFGTRVQFRYHGRTVTAVVRDRGPYVSGRTFDLGPGTAKALGFSGVGTVSYRIVH